MSKHVWRGKSVVNTRFGDSPPDCTVVEDAACFPVKEAMRLIAAYEVTVTCNSFDTLAYLGEARRKYLAARARMKAKKGKK